MSFKTYAEVRDFVQKKLDLQEEAFISAEELLEYCEEAVKYCEAEIHKLNIEDQYFVAEAPLVLASGKYDIALPSNMYANKILRVVYSRGSEVYTLNRLTKKDRFEDSELLKQNGGSSQSWEYMLINNDPRVGTRMRIYPTSSESSTVVSATGTTALSSAVVSSMSTTTNIEAGFFVSGTGIADGTKVLSVDSSTQVTLDCNAVAAGVGSTLTFTDPRLKVWYVRRAKIPTDVGDYIDFPEFWPFVAQHMIVECLKKELGNPRLAAEEAKLEALRVQVSETLSNMVPDQDDTIEKDISLYEDMNLTGDLS